MKKNDLNRLINNAGHSEMKKIQKDSVQGFDKHNELILYSKTGSGKTLAFLLSILAKTEDSPLGSFAIIIVPSRELSIQIEEVFRSLKSGKKVTVCYGGHSMSIEKKSLEAGTDIIIGTPGRITDHINRENLVMEQCNFLVIDEFDKCLELGFKDEMKYIVECLPNLKYKMLVSATKMEEIPSYLNIYKPLIIDGILDDGLINIKEHVVEYKGEIISTLSNLIKSFKDERTIVFCNYREVVEDVSMRLEKLGITSSVYHGGMEQIDREKALIKFRNGSATVLICTDLGSRGLDVPKINHVVHYQYPNSEEAFIHRKGRTARMTADGNSYLLSGPETQLPHYIQMPSSKVKVSDAFDSSTSPIWTTLYFSAGRKDKINKIDLVGFLSKKGELSQDEIGLITVQDKASYVAINKNKASAVLLKIKGEKVKGKKLKIEISK